MPAKKIAASKKPAQGTKKTTATKSVAKKSVKTPAKTVKKTTATKKPAAKTAEKTTTKKVTTKATSKITKKTTAKTTTPATKKKLPTKSSKVVAEKSVKKSIAKPIVKKLTSKKQTPPTEKTITDLPTTVATNKEKNTEPNMNTKKTNMIDSEKKITELNATVGSALGFEPYEKAPHEGYMSADMKKHFENILLLWKQQLMEEVDSTVSHMKEEAINLPDPVDRAALEEGFNLELRTRDRERKLIRKIEQSLEEIKSGDYGFCEDCGVEIGVRRLEARPTASKCIDCKTYQEIREKQEGTN